MASLPKPPARPAYPAGPRNEFAALPPEGDNPFLPLLERVRSELDGRLTAFFDDGRARFAKRGNDVLAMVDAVRELTMRGGKRFRPALLVAAYFAVDTAAPIEPALDAGVALELLQSYLLIHDDWMDRDEMRRGGPAVHVLLSRHFGSRLTGEASGVLAGDFAAALSLEALARLRTTPERLGRVLAAFAEIQQDAICGQQLDLAARPDNVEAMHELKTGSYTVRGPLLLGAHLGGASPDALERLERFARPLGVAFQLRDDLLGAFGDPASTGKPFGSDIRAGKRTTLLVEALARLGEAQRKVVTETVGRRDASDQAVRRVIDLYESCGARSAVERRLDELVASARSSLDTACFAPGGSAYLIGAASVLTRRQN